MLPRRALGVLCNSALAWSRANLLSFIRILSGGGRNNLSGCVWVVSARSVVRSVGEEGSDNGAVSVHRQLGAPVVAPRCGVCNPARGKTFSSLYDSGKQAAVREEPERRGGRPDDVLRRRRGG